MLFFVDIIPLGCALWGPQALSNRQDIEQPEDGLMLQHRAVWMLFGTHFRGPACPCCPIVRTAGEWGSPGFLDRPDFHGTACN